MKVYKEKQEIIALAQYKDPLMDHLSEIIMTKIGKGKGKKLLDIGCGAGRNSILAAIRGYEVTGIDQEKNVIDLARDRARQYGMENNCKFITNDLFETQKIKQNFFDVVICSEVIEHIDDPGKIVQVSYNSLKAGGLAVFTTPHSLKQWTVLDDYGDHKKRFEIDEIIKYFSKFNIISIFTVGFPFLRIIFKVYNLLSKKLHLQHGSSWREKSTVNNSYYSLIRLLLKFDDLFSLLNLGTNIVIIAAKN